MSQLQLGLVILGGLMLLSMAAYYAWLVHKNKPRKPTGTSTTGKSTKVQGADGGGSRRPSDTGVEPALDAKAFELNRFLSPVPEKKPPLDSVIDAIVPITLDAPLSGQMLLGAIPAARRIGTKFLAIEGQNADSLLMEPPVKESNYIHLQAGIQLANRAGALNDIEFSEFVVKTQAFCDAIGGTPAFPEMKDEIHRARELDQFACDHDAQLGFILRARQAAWSPAYITQTATRMGFVPGSVAGRMVLPASLPHTAPVLSLSFDTQSALAGDAPESALREVVLSLDVTHVQRGEDAFDRMRTIALALAAEMDGIVTDDRGMALPLEAMDVIAKEVSLLYDVLDQRGLSAGSPLARRLFS